VFVCILSGKAVPEITYILFGLLTHSLIARLSFYVSDYKLQSN